MRRSSAFFTALITTALPALLTPPAPAQAAPPSTPAAPVPAAPPSLGSGASGRAGGPIDLVGLDFQLINAAGRQCLTSGLTVLPCATSDAYRWRFRPVAFAGTFEILNVRTNTCLTMPGGISTPGARAGLAPCAAVPSRRWELRDSLGDTAKVVNTRTGKCLQVQGGVAVQDSCAGTHGTRRWTVRVVGLPIFAAG